MVGQPLAPIFNWVDEFLILNSDALFREISLAPNTVPLIPVAADAQADVTHGPSGGILYIDTLTNERGGFYFELDALLLEAWGFCPG